MQLLKSRISKMIKSNNNTYITLVQTPAPDPYSQPSTYKLSSNEQLGQPGDELDIVCSLRSWVKIKPYVEKDTGIKKEFWEQNTIFDVTDFKPSVNATPLSAASK